MFKKIPRLSAAIVASSIISFSFSQVVQAKAAQISHVAQTTADYAVAQYKNDMVESLRALVKHNTVAQDGVLVDENPAHIAFKAELKKQAQTLNADQLRNI